MRRSYVHFSIALGLLTSGLTAGFSQLRVAERRLEARKDELSRDRTAWDNTVRMEQGRGAELARSQDAMARQVLDSDPGWPPTLRAGLARALGTAGAQPGCAGEDPLLQSKVGKVYFPELLGQKDYARAAAAIERTKLERDYADLLSALGLPAGRRDQLLERLVDREMAKQDVLGIEQDQTQPTRMRQRLEEAREWRREVARDFGPEVVNRIQAEDGQLILRGITRSLETRLSYTETPLSSEQAGRVMDALVQALGPKVGSRYWTVSDALLGSLRDALVPEQMAVLREIQEEHAALVADHAGRASP